MYFCYFVVFKVTLKRPETFQCLAAGKEELMRNHQNYSLYHDNSIRRYEGMSMIEIQ